MAMPVIARARGAFDRLPPRLRQYGTAAAIAGCSVGLLWAVFALSSTKAPTRPVTPGRPADTRTTNVDVLAPGSQLSEVDNWVGTAGKTVAQLRADREEQSRINRERAEFEAKTMARFTDLEKRLVPAASPPTTALKPPEQPAPVLSPASEPTSFPPGAALDARTSPSGVSPPVGRGTIPLGSPGPIPLAPAPPPVPMLVKVSLPDAARTNVASTGSTPAGKPPLPNIDTFLPVSFTRGQMLGGLDAPTGGQSQSNPQPVLIRLSDNSVLPNRFRAEYRECFVIAAGYGDISSERAYLRTENLSCVKADGTALEVKIQGSVYGEDGKVGMRGRLVTKQGQMLANALLAGVVGGIGQGLSTSNTTYSTSALGQVSTTSGGETFKSGVGSGVGRALDRLAQYYIKLAENTFPVIEVDAGREIDVVITKGVRINPGIDAASDAVPTSSVSPARRDNNGLHSKVNDDDDQ